MSRRGRAWAAAAVLAVSSLGGFAGAGAQTPDDDATPQVSAPSIVLYPSDRSMTVAWEPPADLPADAVVTYDIAWIASDEADEPDAEWNTIRGVAATPAYHLLQSREFANNISYDVKVRAVTGRAGQWSAAASATTFERAGSSAIRRSRPAIPYGVRIGGHIDFAGPDSFNFRLTERAGVLIRTGGRVRSTECSLYHDSGAPVPSGYFHSTFPAHCSIYAIFDAGVHYVVVEGHNQNASRWNHGSFFVSAETMTPAGRSRDAALPVTVGEEVFGYMGLDWGGADFWRLDIAAREFIDIHIETFDDRDHVETSLLDSTGAKQEAIVGPLHAPCYFAPGSGSRCIYSGKRVRAELAAGTYYIKVQSPSRYGVSYSLKRYIDNEYQSLVTQCEAIARGEGVNDPLAGCQWHLDNRGQGGARVGEDANVTDAHRAGHLGEGVHVAVVDSGIDLAHADLSANTASSRSHAYCGGDTASFRSGSDHGTAVAGLVAARDNAIGMRGVAPRATLHNRRLLCGDRDLSAANLADAMTRSIASICVNTNSWGHTDGPPATPVTSLFDLALAKGLTTGCGGKGTSYVWAAGNGHQQGDDANLDELSNHYGVMAVCAVNARGRSSVYSEEGTNLWVCGPSNDLSAGVPEVATTTNHSRYRTDFGGTSAAAPIVAGVAALVRAANPELTWRDVKLILAASARRNDSGDSGWKQGATRYGEPGERYWYSRRYGFGTVDAAEAAELAEEWTNLPAMITQTETYDGKAFQIPDAPASISKSVTFDDAIKFVEFVQIDTSFKTPHLRDLKIELISPSGTEAVALPELPHVHVNNNNTALNEPFRFGVAQFLGEPAQGPWTLRVSGKASNFDDYEALLESWGLTLYGHRLRPSAPTPTEAVPGPGDLAVRWSAPSYAGASAVSGYEVRHIAAAATDRSDSQWTVEAVPGGAAASEYTIAGLAAVPLDVQVRALNDSGDGAWSATVSGTPKPGTNVEPVFAMDAVRLQVAEDAVVGTAVGEPVVAVDDDDGAELAYSLSGTDAAGFAIDGATGQISLSSALDYEAPADSDGDNAYELTVSVSDGRGDRGVADTSTDDSVAVTVEVTGVDEPPVLAARGCDLVIPEGLPHYGSACTLAAFDAEAAPLRWSLSGADAARFALIDTAAAQPGSQQHTRMLFFKALFDVDFEAPADADGDSVFEVTVTAGDTSHEVSVDISVSVRDTDEPFTVICAPAQHYDAANQRWTLAEPQRDPVDDSLDPAGLVAGRCTASDPEGAPAVWSLSGVDAATFDIADDGTLSFVAAPDFEAPADSNLDNLYDVTVAATAGAHTLSASLRVAVTDTPEPHITVIILPPPPRECGTAPEVTPDTPTEPICATVHGNEFTLTFNRDLAAVDETTAAALRWAFLIDGAWHQGRPVDDQSPSQVAVDGATVTLTLGTPIQPDRLAIVTYRAAAAANGLKHTDGTPVADFTTRLITAQRD